MSTFEKSSLDRKTKVALFSTYFLPYSQTFIYDEIHHHANNYEIEVFCKKRLNKDRFPFQKAYNPGNFISRFIFENFLWLPKYNRLLKNNAFDLVHAHFGTGAVYMLPFAKRAKLPLVVTFHGYDVAALMPPENSKWAMKRYNHMIKEIFSYSSLLLAASEELKSLLIQHGAPEDKVKVYRLGIDLKKFQFDGVKKSSDTFSFTLIGRFTEKKGHIYALEAFNKIHDKYPKSELNFIGDGELSAELKKYVAENNLQECVNFLGILTPQEVAEQLKRTHVLLAPSIIAKNKDRESGLLVVKEAAAVGVPSIGTWHGGIPEIIDDEKTGFLVKERDSSELSEKMELFIQKDELASSMGKAARIKMENEYDLSKSIKKLESLYDSILEPSR